MTRQESAPIVTTRLPQSTQWIICVLLTLILAPTLRAQDTSALAEKLAHNRRATHSAVSQEASAIYQREAGARADLLASVPTQPAD